jgi:hypothetical protein
MYRPLLCLLLLFPLKAEIVDRIAITVDQQVITELQIEEELRVTAFLNHSPLSRDINTRRAAADRLIAQLLVAREMQISHYQPEAASKTGEYLTQVRATFKSDADYRAALVSYSITERTLEQHLANQLNTLKFVQVRFRPNVDRQKEDAEQILDIWLEEARKQVSIVYHDKELQ